MYLLKQIIVLIVFAINLLTILFIVFYHRKKLDIYISLVYKGHGLIISYQNC